MNCFEREAPRGHGIPQDGVRAAGTGPAGVRAGVGASVSEATGNSPGCSLSGFGGRKAETLFWLESLSGFGGGTYVGFACQRAPQAARGGEPGRAGRSGMSLGNAWPSFVSRGLSSMQGSVWTQCMTLLYRSCKVEHYLLKTMYFFVQTPSHRECPRSCGRRRDSPSASLGLQCYCSGSNPLPPVSRRSSPQRNPFARKTPLSVCGRPARVRFHVTLLQVRIR